MQDKDIINMYDTPFYLFDIDILYNRLQYLKEMLGLDLCYAVKANPFVIHEVEPKVQRLEICSEGEYDICEKLNVPKDKMVISGVYKTPIFIEKLVKLGNDYIFTIESLTQFNQLYELSLKYKKTLKIMPRLTSGNQFGINSKELLDIVRKSLNNEYLNIIGLEYFSGTQKYSLKKIEREIVEIKEIIDTIKKELDYDIKELEYGGGFPVEYFNENKFNEEEYLITFKNLIEDNFKNIKITIELGRSIVSSCGKYYTKVVDLKQNDIGEFAIVDGGMNHLVYYGQTMAMKLPSFKLIPSRKEGTKNYNICGALCTINDIIIKQLPLSDLKINDCFVFENTGAYCMCEGISLFLSRDLPKIIIKKGCNLRVARDVYKTSILNTPEV